MPNAWAAARLLSLNTGKVSSFFSSVETELSGDFGEQLQCDACDHLRKLGVPNPTPAKPSFPQTVVHPDDLQGFILTRRSRDLPIGTELEYWVATETGPRKILLTGHVSTAFARAADRQAVETHALRLPGIEIRALELKTFQQDPVVGVYAKQHRQLTKLARALAPQKIPLFEADVRPHERYLMERFITAGVVIEGGAKEGGTIFDCPPRQNSCRIPFPSG